MSSEFSSEADRVVIGVANSECLRGLKDADVKGEISSRGGSERPL